MPKTFPGYKDKAFEPDTEIPPGFLAKVYSSWFLSRAVDAASQIPTAPTPETVEAHFQQIDLVIQSLEYELDMVRRIKAWSRRNLGPDLAPKPEPARGGRNLERNTRSS